MRLSAALAAFAALLLPGPAAADITARYHDANGLAVTVRLSDGGDSRTETQHAVYLTSGGIDYLVAGQDHGGFVVRLDDFVSLMTEQSAAWPAADPPAEPMPVTISEAGTEIVAGRTGRRFRIAAAGQSTDAAEMVISSDPDLAPLGAVLRRHFGPVLTAFGARNPGIARAMADLLGRGTLLRGSELFRLESIDNAALSPSLFTLPSPPISREELAARMHALVRGAAGDR